MEKRGCLVWWHIPLSVRADSEIVNRFLLGDYEPRNDSKTALQKTVVSAKSKFGWGEEETKNRMNPMHIRPTDNPDETVWEIVKPIKDGTLDTGLNLIARATYNKRTKTMVIKGSDDVKQFFSENYSVSSNTLDNNQVAAIVNRAINGYGRSGCMGIVMRVTGGIYFVPDFRRKELDNVSEFLKAVGGKLHQCSLYNDSDEALEDASASELRKELKSEIDRLRNETASLNGRALRTRIRRIDSLKNKATVHIKSLKDSYDSVSREINILLTTLETQMPGELTHEVCFDLDKEMEIIALGKITHAPVEEKVKCDPTPVTAIDVTAIDNRTELEIEMDAIEESKRVMESLRGSLCKKRED